MTVGELHINRESGPKPDPMVDTYRAEAAKAWKFHAVIESEMRHRVEEISALQGAIRELESRLSKIERKRATKIESIQEYL